MKRAGILIPTELEGDLLLQNLITEEVSSFQNKTFHAGLLNSVQVAICLCGVGKTNGAHGATLLIEKYKPDIVYMLGVAGAYPLSELVIGDVVIAEKESYGDEGLLLANECRLMDTLHLPLASIGGREYFNEFFLHVPEKLRRHKNRGNFVTVSSCTGTLKRAEALQAQFHAICETMEGAAVAHICTLNSVPMVEVRGISNIVGERTGEPINRSDLISASERVQGFFLDQGL